MRFLCVQKPTQAVIFGQEFTLKPLDAGLENIQDILATDNFSAAELLLRHPGMVASVSFDREKCDGFPLIINELNDFKGSGKILILRNGGIGDHVLLLPALQVFRTVFPKGSQIWLSAQKEKHPIFRNHKAIDRILPLPLPMDVLLEADYLIDFSERDDLEDFHHLHMTDYYLNFLGIDYTRIVEKAPRIPWNAKETHPVRALFEGARDQTETARLFVLLNWTASNALRQLAPDTLLFLVDRFPDVQFVVAQHQSLSVPTKQALRRLGIPILDLTPYMANLSDYMTAIQLCDAVVTTDTGTVHLAEALNKPSLVLYGPTQDERWIQYYRHVYPLRAEYVGDTCCSPCGLIKSIQGCTESQLNDSPYSPCLVSITPERIQDAFKGLLERIRS